VTAARILVVEDSKAIRLPVVTALSAHGFELASAANGGDLEKLLPSFAPDLVILDVMLPGRDGFELLRVVRRTSTAAVLMLTARDSLADRLLGLTGGADDYLIKPFAMAELVARIHAVLRRSRPGGSSISIDDLVINDDATLVQRGGDPLDLTETERRLLATSTGKRVIAGAPCPVAMPPRGWRDRALHDLGRIGVAFVPTPDGREALRVAAMLALRVGARLHVVTVVAGPAEVMSYRIGEDVDRMYVSAAKETFEQSIEQAISELASDITASGEVIVGDDPVEMLAAMANSSFDAFFVGSRGYGPIRRVLLGGVASRLLRRLDIPAVIVPRAG